VTASTTGTGSAASTPSTREGASDGKTTGSAEGGGVPSSSIPATGADGAGPGLVRRSLPSALELLALTAFVIARPVFASFGKSPETFLARGADWTDVIAFAVILVLGPPLVLIVVEVAVGLLLGERVRRWFHLACLAVLLGAAVYQLIEETVGWETTVSTRVSVVAGLALAALCSRVTSSATFLRYASVGAIVFLAQFLAMSPTSAIVFGGRHAASDVGATGLGDDAPPVVLVVFDGLPTEALLDGHGQIDAELYPNLASLAGDATWYRNHTTVAQATLWAVPAILSGTLPPAEQPAPVATNYPENIFTLLGGSHEVHSGELITGLCPVRVCPEPPGSPVGALLGDARDLWTSQMSNTVGNPRLIPYVFDDRDERTEEWIAAQDFTPGDRPGLYVLHMMSPHPTWEYLPDGSPYTTATNHPRGLFREDWSDWGTDIATQRHVLQTQNADRMLGRLLDRLRDEGVYDDALVAVTADHGYAFAEGASIRWLDRANYDQIMWTPLLVKAPGQRRGAIDDANVTSLDILPTIAAELGIDELPWDVDGAPAGTEERDPDDKWILDVWQAELGARGDSDIVRVDGTAGFDRVLAADWVEGTGPEAVWRRTEYGDLVGQSVDELPVGAATGDVMTVNDLDTWDDVDMDLPSLELVARGLVPPDSAVAITADGVVAAVVPPGPSAYGIDIVHALLWPGALHDGANEIGVYAVDGPATAPVLRPYTVEARAPE
jgi:hypothetical protein